VNTTLEVPSVLSGVGEVIVAGAPVTVCDNTADVLPELLLSPPYTAVMLRTPNASPAVVKVAIPDAFRAPEPRVVEPSLKTTVPEALLSAEVTAAVNVTEVPSVEGFIEEVKMVVEARVDA
jgi:hypothetical protein